jgi:hypothetical protein
MIELIQPAPGWLPVRRPEIAALTIALTATTTDGRGTTTSRTVTAKR